MMNETSLLKKIERTQSTMTKAEQKVANFMVENAHLVPNMTTKDVSEKAGVSEATIVRFCKTIGTGSFKAFKMTLVKELFNRSIAVNDFSLLQSKDSPYELFQKVTHVNKAALESAIAALDKRELNKAVEALCEAKTILFYGVGGSAPTAADGHYKFAKLGCRAATTPDFHFMLSMVSHLKKGDVFVAISTSGKTKDVLDLVKFAHEQEATVIAIANAGKSPLSKEADILLGLPSVEPENRIGSIASRTVQLNMIDALYVGAFHRLGSSVESAYKQASQTADRLKR